MVNYLILYKKTREAVKTSLVWSLKETEIMKPVEVIRKHHFYPSGLAGCLRSESQLVAIIGSGI